MTGRSRTAAIRASKAAPTRGRSRLLIGFRVSVPRATLPTLFAQILDRELSFQFPAAFVDGRYHFDTDTESLLLGGGPKHADDGSNVPRPLLRGLSGGGAA